MKKVVVTSSRNLAGMNITKKNPGVHKLDSSIVELEGLDKIKADLFIVASSHKSKAGIPSFTAHSPGNFGPNKFGGERRSLSISPALYVSEAVRKFSELKNAQGLKQEVSLEVTHHGPTFAVPIVFVEVGSSLSEWKSDEATGAAAEVINHLLGQELEGEACIGIGGSHYAPYFTGKVLEGLNIGHICPKYALGELDKQMFRQMVERTVPKPYGVILDDGTPGEVKSLVKAWSGELGLEVI